MHRYDEPNVTLRLCQHTRCTQTNGQAELPHQDIRRDDLKDRLAFLLALRQQHVLLFELQRALCQSGPQPVVSPARPPLNSESSAAGGGRGLHPAFIPSTRQRVKYPLIHSERVSSGPPPCGGQASCRMAVWPWEQPRGISASRHLGTVWYAPISASTCRLCGDAISRVNSEDTLKFVGDYRFGFYCTTSGYLRAGVSMYARSGIRSRQ